MSFRPSHFLGKPLNQLLDALALQSAVGSMSESEGQIELYCASALEKQLVCLPETILCTTLPETTPPDDHLEVDLPGVVLEKYLGQGGQGWVYAGRIVQTGRIVAVKVLRADTESDRSRALREALLGSRVRHRNVLRVLRAEPAGPYWTIIMELVQGRDLDSTPLDQEQFSSCFHQLADALLTLAQQQLVHCDVKPSNILVRFLDGSPVLVDFGVAWDLADAKAQYSLFGTPYYLPPEAFELPGRPEPSWDAYALGITAAVAKTGRSFPWRTLASLESAKLSGEFDWHVRGELQNLHWDAAEPWIGQLLDSDPARRLEALEDLAVGNARVVGRT
jgi:serine/threonine protein kinase